MEKLFTPGPWHVSSQRGFASRNGLFLGIYATNDDLEVITQVHKDVLLHSKVQNHNANAALIAAAPDLLEACMARTEARTTKELEQADNLMLAAITKALTINQP